MKDSVDVKPSFGILNDHGGEKQVALIRVKFIGRITDIEKTKLQIKWIPIIQGNPAIDKQLTHDEFN